MQTAKNLLVEIPQTVLEQYNRLAELCEKSKDFNISAQEIANLIGKDKTWLLRTTYNGACPFGFGSDIGVARGNCCYPVLTTFQWMTQAALFRPGTGHFQDAKALSKV